MEVSGANEHGLVKGYRRGHMRRIKIRGGAYFRPIQFRDPLLKGLKYFALASVVEASSQREGEKVRGLGKRVGSRWMKWVVMPTWVWVERGWVSWWVEWEGDRKMEI